VITDTVTQGTTTAGSTPITIVPAGKIPSSILVRSTGPDAVIEMGYQNGTDEASWRPILSPRLLPAGTSARITLPAFRMNPYHLFRIMARSSAPVAWIATLLDVPSVTNLKTSFRGFDARPGVRTAIFGPSLTERTWRGVSVIYCNRSAASSMVSLSMRVRESNGDFGFREFAGPIIVPPFGGVRLSPFPDVSADSETAIFGQTETFGSFYTYGVQK
jgi:hypothetical protein